MAAKEFPEEIKAFSTCYLHSHATPASGNYVWYLNAKGMAEEWAPKIFNSYESSEDNIDVKFEGTYDDTRTYSNNKIKVTTNNINYMRQAFVAWLVDGGTELYLTEKWAGTNRATNPTFGDITTMVITRCKIIRVRITEKIQNNDGVGVWTYTVIVQRVKPVIPV